MEGRRSFLARFGAFCSLQTTGFACFVFGPIHSAGSGPLTFMFALFNYPDAHDLWALKQPGFETPKPLRCPMEGLGLPLEAEARSVWVVLLKTNGCSELNLQKLVNLCSGLGAPHMVFRSPTGPGGICWSQGHVFLAEIGGIARKPVKPTTWDPHAPKHWIPKHMDETAFMMKTRTPYANQRPAHDGGWGGVD